MQNFALQIGRLVLAMQNQPDAYLVAIAGIPGSGKSTLCESLSTQIPGLVVLPMDGYHIPLCDLKPEDIKRRGAPHTFNHVQFRTDLINLRKNRKGSFPGFDHSVKDPEPDAIEVTADCPIVFVEGNYLLLNSWNLVDQFDFTVFLDCDLELAMQRVENRLVQCGIVSSREAAKEQVSSNDRMNAGLILEDGGLLKADLVLEQRA